MTYQWNKVITDAAVSIQGERQPIEYGDVSTSIYPAARIGGDWISTIEMKAYSRLQ